MMIVRLLLLLFIISSSLWSFHAQAQHEDSEPSETQGAVEVILPMAIPDGPARAAERKAMDDTYTAIPKYTYNPTVVQRTPSQIATLGTLLLNTPYGEWTPEQKKLGYVIAHRGFHSEPGVPEHSPASLNAAYLAGSDGVEIDTKITADGYVVLGHDFTMAREMTNWGGQGTTTRWDPILNYPVVDPFYANLATGDAFNDNSDLNNPANPKRSKMSYENVMAAEQLDNFGNLSPIVNSSSVVKQTQMSLYEALYFIAKYAPMQIWLDVKAPDHFRKSAAIINQLRADLAEDPEALKVLEKIFFKLSYGQFAKEFPNGFDKSLSTILDTTGVGFFFIFQPNDLPTFAAINGADGDPFLGFQKYCRFEVGCVGAEFTFKSPDGPGQYFMDTLKKKQVLQASFHNAPPYLWRWSAQSAADRIATYGRWFARAESCCSDRVDVMKLDKASKEPEIDDLRPSAYFMEQGYNFITTDDAVGVLNDLIRDGRRSVQDAATASPASSLASSFEDGLYMISPLSTPLASFLHARADGGVDLVAAETGPTVTSNGSVLWYLRHGSKGTITLQGAVPGASYLGQLDNGSPSAKLVPLDQLTEPNKYSPTLILGAVSPGVMIKMEGKNVYLGESSGSVNWSTQKSGWLLTPVEFPFPGRSTSTLGPRGMQFCAEVPLDDKPVVAPSVCTVPPSSTVAYGSRQDFLLRDFSAEQTNVPCEKATFGVSGEADGSIAECFYAPPPSVAPLGKNFEKCADVNKTCPVTAVPTAIAIVSGTRVLSYRNAYKGATGEVTCNPGYWTVTPPDGATACFIVKEEQIGPEGFAYCADEGEICSFNGVGAIAYGDPTTKGYIYRTFRGSATCSTANFIADPAPDSKEKKCYYMDVSKPRMDRYKKLAQDGESFTFDGRKPYIVFYGTQESWIVGRFDQGRVQTVPCSPETFGHQDPAPGRLKACIGAPAYQIDATGLLNFDFYPCPPKACNSIGETIAAWGVPPATSDFEGVSVDYAIGDGSTECAFGSRGFNRDPEFGVNKACMIARLDLPQQAPEHFTFCARQGETCYIEGIQSHAAYGARGNFTYDWAKNESFLCDKSSFNDVDPNVGVYKACYVYYND
jgi:glycerophosphoryl diester phosphodiesterase